MENIKISMLAAGAGEEARSVTETGGRGAGRVTCCGGLGDTAHDPITFDGHFRALCPLCAALEKVKDTEERAETTIQEYEEDADRRAAKAEEHRETAEKRLDLAEEALEGAAAQLKEADRGGVLDNAAALRVAAAIEEFLKDLRRGALG